MEPDNEEKILDEKIQERFKALPKALQNAITSADVEKKLRDLSDVHKLHLDQWQKLENEVMLALLGFQPVEKLVANIKNEVGLTDEIAEALAGDIADTIFQPIRAELERELGKPEDEPVASSLQPVAEKPVASSQQPVASTPPPAPPMAKSVRATLSPAYASDTKSHERKTVDDDPYREAIG
ncbi:hypothetical protein A3C86_02135 [Candidatus Kaiserbacteria bacterium RIFCSPHIGHO2_02_FULL_49_16]|uniref:Uncharacterized protein n=2 Tax=Parcubacteria group TaxID=1794811 RepID=A0A0G1WF94_9BACT|nr:MAG: hypothetical protein UY58_C0003G0030 [Candidatus Magasanikbacteria bacterium GW2011_GWA2_50_22]OGG58743.1 MAG: hypothetical protein A3C86_02135 [Candidatus Kaiserbacteria bacterium RIFCSPHIGHO2_02_FULL_49_16]